jgi:hypothetical protein
MDDPREPRGGWQGSRGSLLSPLDLAHQAGSLLPDGDPFGELRQVGPGGDAQRRLERPARPPTVSRVLLVESQDDPGPLGQQVAAVARNLAQFSERGLDVWNSDALSVIASHPFVLLQRRTLCGGGNDRTPEGPPERIHRIRSDIATWVARSDVALGSQP